MYGGGLITDAAFLVEFIAERVAVKEGKNLPIKFWSTLQWKKWFSWQIVAANELLAEGLTCVQIMAFLRSKAGKNILSLGQKKLIVEGAARLQPVHFNTSQVEVNTEDDFILESITINTFTGEETLEYKKDTSLWEKLQ